MCARTRAYRRHQAQRTKARTRRFLLATRAHDWAQEVASDPRIVGMMARTPCYRRKHWLDTAEPNRRELLDRISARELQPEREPQELVYKWQPDGFEMHAPDPEVSGYHLVVVRPRSEQGEALAPSRDEQNRR